VSSLRSGIAQFLRRMTVLQLLEKGRPGASHEGPRAVGIGQRRGCRDRVSWRRHPATGSHLPAEGTAPPFAVAPRSVARGAPRSGDRAAQGMPRPRFMAPASRCGVAPFRVIAPCPAPQKPYTPLRSTAGFRFKPNHPVRVHSVDMLLYFDPNRDGIHS
jgi:hypothetical protein